MVMISVNTLAYCVSLNKIAQLWSFFMSDVTINLTAPLYQYLQAHSLREPEVLTQLRVITAAMHGARMQISPEQGQFMALLIITCDVDTNSTSVAKKFWQEAGVANKIELKLAPAVDTLKVLLANGEAGTFDFAFIDADKDNYSNYYELCLQLLRRGGVIAVDNVLWSGRVADSGDQDKTTVAIRKVNDLIHQDERVQMSMLPIGDGLTLAVKI
jgi:predicted O-methyltransferase YrrM